MDTSLLAYGRLFRRCGLSWLGRALEPRDGVRVTYTHGVRAGDRENFRRIVEYLCSVRTVVPPEQILSVYRGERPLGGRWVAMTFDDGLLSGYEAARQVLDPLGIKAIFFVPTAILDLRSEEEGQRFAAANLLGGLRDPGSLTPEECRFMTAAHMRELAAGGHMICPHTHSHRLLRDIRDEAAAERELIRPKGILESLLKQEVHAFAFPVGTERTVSPYAHEYARRTYDLCFTALNGVNTARSDPHRLHRDCVPAESSLEYVRMVMEGTYDLYYRLKMARFRRRTAPVPRTEARPWPPALQRPDGPPGA